MKRRIGSEWNKSAPGYADDVIILGEKVNTLYTLKISREDVLDVNTGKSRYIFIARQQISEKNHNLLIANKSFGYQNCIHEEIRSTLNSRNACYYSVQNLLPSHQLSKNLKYKKHNFASCFVWV
jgi:hypothetical protein